MHQVMGTETARVGPGCQVDAGNAKAIVRWRLVRNSIEKS